MLKMETIQKFILAVPVPDPGLLEKIVSLDPIANPRVGELLEFNLLEKDDPAASRDGDGKWD